MFNYPSVNFKFTVNITQFRNLGKFTKFQNCVIFIVVLKLFWGNKSTLTLTLTLTF